jgi:uncharacterized RDD family membrane protein YckC
MPKENGIQNGVFYKSSDYGTLVRRFSAMSVDMLFLIVLFLIIDGLWGYIENPPDLRIISNYGWLAMAVSQPKYFFTCTALAYIYLAVIKPSGLRTIGYRLANLRIVNMNGDRPSLFQMTWRFVLLILGPFHFLIDLFWLGGDENRQTLRDKFAGTYVIKPGSIPSGTGPFIFATYYVFGLSLMFREVKRSET